jgi:hypothetical protein
VAESESHDAPEGAATGREDDDAPGHAHMPLGEDAARLFAAAQVWLQNTITTAAHADYSGSDCQWCPLCQFAAMLRGDRPEVTERVAEAGTAVAGAFRALLDATANTYRPAHAEPQPPGESKGETEPEPGPRVQHIDLGDAP